MKFIASATFAAAHLLPQMESQYYFFVYLDDDKQATLSSYDTYDDADEQYQSKTDHSEVVFDVIDDTTLRPREYTPNMDLHDWHLLTKAAEDAMKQA